MILFHQVIVDLASFNESHLGIFNDAEQPVLLNMLRAECGGSALKFFSLLSPEQKQHVVLWACEKTSFSTSELIASLKKFTKYLEGVSYAVYPKTAPQPDKKKKKKMPKF